MMGRRLLGLVLLLISAIAIVVIAQTDSGDKRLSVDEAREMISDDTNVVVLDVRREEEYKSETGHLANAILIPVQEIEERIGELEPLKEKVIIAYCRTGRRSEKAAGLLGDHGFKVYTMEGGIVRWNELRLPVVKEEEH